MTNKSRKQASLKLTQARKGLAEARKTENPRNIAMAAANLGFALYSVNKFQEGARSFKEVDMIFKKLDDVPLQIHCLSLKTMAYQVSEQYPQAFKAAQQLEAIAVENGELAIQADTLATQGQILIDSGEEVIALEKLKAALEIAEDLKDMRRRMNVLGALGNYCMTIASPDKAGDYFEQARALARELEDKPSEIGFHGNIGALLEWKGELEQAGQIFDDVVSYMRQAGNKEAEVQALRHLVQVHLKRKDDMKVAFYAQDGADAAKEIDEELLYFFYEHLIGANYRLNRLDAAHKAAVAAIEIARYYKNRQREVNFLLGLGESYMAANQLMQALPCYQQALEGTQRLQRLVDKAYLLGRIGVILAELNQVDEAVDYHKQAIEMAQKQELPDLEAEQSIMLAMAYMDQGKFDEATTFCETAVSLYTKAGLTEQADRAQVLLAQIGV